MLARRRFLAAAGSSLTLPLLFQPSSETFASSMAIGQDERSPLDPELVSRFVGRSHGNLEAVREMLGQEKQLVFASWDWGNGDWETGLGAASHVGRRDIAEYLLDEGARIDAFAAAMLGMNELLAALIAAQPEIHAVPGPHGIPLLSHAIVGRDQASDALQLILASGADVNGSANGGRTALMMAAGMGNIDGLQTLLEHGADPNQKDSEDKTALDFARDREQAEVIAILEELG